MSSSTLRGIQCLVLRALGWELQVQVQVCYRSLWHSYRSLRARAYLVEERQQVVLRLERHADARTLRG